METINKIYIWYEEYSFMSNYINKRRHLTGQWKPKFTTLRPLFTAWLNLHIHTCCCMYKIIHEHVYELQIFLVQWTAVAQWLRCCATDRNVAGSITVGVIGFFIDIKPFRSRYGLGVDSASNRNEYQVHFLGVKVRKADNLPPPCAVVTKSGNLNFLEPSGLVQACNGTALHLPLDISGPLYIAIIHCIHF